MKPRIIELSNGLRIVHKYIPYTRTVHCGYIINTGSRDDKREEIGMAHFIEHMVFKGTVRRSNLDILNYLDSLGGDLNAYTTKEKTCLYASLSAEHFERAIDLLTDITFFSTFPVEEIGKEQDVIAEEIDMYRDAPDEAIFEDFDEKVFPGHDLGSPILGTKESIRAFTQEKVRSHIGFSYTANNIVCSIVGNVTEKQVDQAINKYVRILNLPDSHLSRNAPGGQTEQVSMVPISTQQAHEIIGGRAFARGSEEHLSFFLFNNYMGGPAMNSRLNLNIRERYGLTYSINSFFNPFHDSGIWGIYYACEPKNLKRVRDLVIQEYQDAIKEGFDPVRLAQCKRQLIGQMTLSYENLLTQMLGMGKDLLDYGRIISFSEFTGQIEALTEQQVIGTAHKAWKGEELTRITYQKAV
ncbi:MAG: pitrilysin family protein [Bacteroidota bacterium]